MQGTGTTPPTSHDETQPVTRERRVVRFLPSLLFAGPARFAPRHRAASAVHRGDCGPVVGAPHRGGASPPLPHR